MFFQDFSCYKGGFCGLVSGSIKKRSRFHKLFSENKPVIEKNITSFIYYLEGKDEIRIGDDTIICSKDTVRMCPPSDMQDKKAVCRTIEDGKYITVGFRSETPMLKKIMVIDASSNPKIKELFLDLEKVWVRKYNNYMLNSTALFFRLLEELDKTADAQSKKSESRIEAAVKYIHKHYMNSDFSCGILPEICGLKHTQFTDLFTSEFNTTPSKYVTTLRLSRATELLTLNDMSIQEAASQVGYENPCYFGKIFKEHYGKSPSEYKLYYSKGE